jgi:hypothetical protein
MSPQESLSKERRPEPLVRGREFGIISGQVFLNLLDHAEFYASRGLNPEELRKKLLEDTGYDPALVSDPEFVVGIRKGTDEARQLRAAAQLLVSGTVTELPKVPPPTEARPYGSRWPETGSYEEQSVSTVDSSQPIDTASFK